MEKLQKTVQEFSRLPKAGASSLGLLMVVQENYKKLFHKTKFQKHVPLNRKKSQMVQSDDGKFYQNTSGRNITSRQSVLHKLFPEGLENRRTFPIVHRTALPKQKIYKQNFESSYTQQAE